ncbi:MAG TPA: helix-turn-helix domain-containing protein [Thermoplasmata archaeon]
MERPFRESEKIVIYGLAQDAYLTDASLARKFGMKESTVSSIRRRLMDSRNIYFLNVPSFHKLGCELFVQMYGQTNPAVPKDIKDMAHLSYFDKTPEVFDSTSGEGFIVMSAVFRNFSEYLVAIDRYASHFIHGHSAEKADLKSVFFPVEISRVCYTYNFAPGLHRIFGIDVPRPVPKVPRQLDVTAADLSTMEKRTLVYLTEYPHSTDAQIAQLLGKSRQTVTNIRKRLERKEMFARVCIPLLITWDIDLYAYVHLRFRQDLDPEVRWELSNEDWIHQSYYTMERDTEAYCNYLFKDYKDYVTEMQRMMKPLLDAGVLREEPHISLVSTVAARELRDGHFSGVLKRLVRFTDR